MRKLFYLAFFLMFFLPFAALAASGEPSAVQYKENPLLCGKTYTSADISGIQSGSIAISDDGTEMTFDNVNINDDSSLFTLRADKNDITVRLKGENQIVTTGYVVMYLYYGTITFTGDGSLTTKSGWFDFKTDYSSEIVIENTTLTCEGPTAFGDNNRRYTEKLIIKNSTLKGRKLFGLESLTLIECAFASPQGAYFDQKGLSTQVKDADGNNASSFEIWPLEKLKDGYPSIILYKDKKLLCGHTYTSTELNDIRSGSLTIADDGCSMTFDNLYIDDPYAIFELTNNNCVITLKGENTIFTSKNQVFAFLLCALKITGGGKLTVKSSSLDIYAYSTDITIENVELVCEGQRTLCDNMVPVDNVIVKNSTFKGKDIVRMGSLTLIGCAFVSPREVIFHPDLYTELDGLDFYFSQLFDADGHSISEFEIQPVDGDFSNRVSPWGPGDFTTVVVEKGKSTTMDVKMKNDGEEPIQNISYKLAINGNVVSEQTYTLGEPYANTTTGRPFFIPITFPASDMAGTAEAVITVTKVNGKDNTSNRKSIKGAVATIDKAVARRVVVEEYTGTWCGWCPRGIVAVDMLNKEFGDSVITICVHDGDPMEVSSYPAATMSFPDARVNRGSLIDPYYGSSNMAYGIRDDVARELSNNVLAGIALTATWADEDKTIIKAETETTFMIDTEVTQYGIAYALLEDGMKGTDNGWAQKNFYSGTSTDDPNLKPYTQLPGPITNIEYDHVAVAGWEIDRGVDKCFESLQLYVPQKKVYNCDISGNELIQDKSRLSLVAMLIDRKSNRIVNAAKSAIGEYEESAIKDIRAERTGQSGVYTINGCKVTSSSDEATVNSLPKGIYIVDGRKVVVK